MKYACLLFAAALVVACKSKEDKSIATIERTDPALDALIDPGAQVEIIMDGFDWSEGPLWLPSENFLIVSDVPKNTIFKWTKEKGKEVYLTPSGYTTKAESPYSKEEGSNGLLLSNDGKLVLCQHGDRRVSVMNAPLGSPAADYAPLADNYGGKKLNSPNDAVFNSSGTLFFTDPPYGLPDDNGATKEIPFQGVFKSSNGVVTLISDSVTRPNGIAFFPGERRLIVASSDPEKAIWYTFDLTDSDSVKSASVFYDATSEAKTGAPGLPDGLKVDATGNVFATGPGGVWIFDQSGKVLGKIKVTEPTSNVAFSPDGKTLFITANMYVLQLKIKN
ncbi:MAG TPA: SMP-30/gluconolactonase/LRE family protein [Chryseolinea sp.]|nr:SMP-30/gluconolactonase/LRE family protein [Chryseolinea sp.]